MQADELKARVQALIDAEIAAALSLDARGIEVVDATDGIVQIRLSEVCASCPGTLWTLLTGLEQELRRRIPEIEYLEAVP